MRTRVHRQRRTRTHFDTVQATSMRRSVFDRSFTHKTTFDFDRLYPIYVDEMLPGDTFQVDATVFARLSTPIFPIMDNVYLDTFFFAVPNRLVWDNWTKFMGERVNPDDDNDFMTPVLANVAGQGESLSAYFGIPTLQLANRSPVISLYHRAYNLIYNEWFRAQDIIDSAEVPKGDGPDNEALFPIRKRAKKRDYFTSALPYPQKGDAVTLPLAAQAPISGLGFRFPDGGLATNVNVREYDGSIEGRLVNYAQASPIRSPAQVDPTQGAAYARYMSAGGQPITPGPDIYADLSEVAALTVNELRLLFQTQRFLERDARSGTRYTELIQSHFGVKPLDMRLQRPEYLGGGRTHLDVASVPQTSATNDTSPQGNLSAYATALSGGHSFTYTASEHSMVIGLICAVPDITYQTNLDRMWTRRTRFDYYWPEFAHLGEQAILQREIHLSSATQDPEQVFGYIPRYDDYRYKNSKITGRFNSEFGVSSLDAWHLAQQFGTLSVDLNQSFIEYDTPADRVLAVTTEPHFICDMHFRNRCARVMPTYAVPGLIDHF